MQHFCEVVINGRPMFKPFSSERVARMAIGAMPEEIRTHIPSNAVVEIFTVYAQGAREIERTRVLQAPLGNSGEWHPSWSACLRMCLHGKMVGFHPEYLLVYGDFDEVQREINALSSGLPIGGERRTGLPECLDFVFLDESGNECDLGERFDEPVLVLHRGHWLESVGITLAFNDEHSNALYALGIAGIQFPSVQIAAHELTGIDIESRMEYN